MKEADHGGRSTRRYDRTSVTAGWAVLSVLGLVALAAYCAAPAGGLAAAALMCSVTMISAGVAYRAAVRTTGLVRLVWLSLGAGMTFATLANIPNYGYPLLTGLPTPFPSPVDALFLLTYPCFVIALVALAKLRRGDDHVGNLLDTMILTAGGGMLLWVFVVAPVVHASGLSPLAHVVAALYPTMDLLVFAALTRLVIGTGRNTSAQLLVLSFVALLLADVSYAVALGNGTYHLGGPTDRLLMVSYLLVAVAALHPTASAVGQARVPAIAAPYRMGPGRLLFLGAALLVGPILLATRRDEVAVVACASVACFAMVMTRMALLNRRLTLANSELALRTSELSATQSELLTAARQAGMAEIAVNVLHNVGNVLNSVNVSATLVCQNLRGSKASGLDKAVALMHEHADDLGAFLTSDARGKQLPGYLDKLATALTAERADIDEELRRLTTGVAHIKEIVSAQQSLVNVAGVTETVRISDLVGDSLRMAGAFHGNTEVTVSQDLAEDLEVSLDRHRVLQVLVNLITNALHALKADNARARLLSVCAEVTTGQVLRITVADTGVGIRSEDLARIFAHGFTTRANGHGFGLHSSALAATEMGGALTVHSDGPGNGAVFTLEVPLDDNEAAA